MRNGWPNRASCEPSGRLRAAPTITSPAPIAPLSRSLSQGCTVKSVAASNPIRSTSSPGPPMPDWSVRRMRCAVSLAMPSSPARLIASTGTVRSVGSTVSSAVVMLVECPLVDHHQVGTDPAQADLHARNQAAHHHDAGERHGAADGDRGDQQTGTRLPAAEVLNGQGEAEASVTMRAGPSAVRSSTRV